MVRSWLTFAAAALLVLSSSLALAQDYTAERASDMRTLNRVQSGQRFAFAAENCENASGAEEQLLVWCDLAVSAAFDQRSLSHRDSFTEQEQSALLHAAWLNAVQGLHGPGLYAAARLNRLSFGDATSEPRLAAYAVLANYRDRTARTMITQLTRAAHALALADVQDTDSLQATRRRMVDAVLAGERSPERLWAGAAAAVTLGLEWPNYPRDWDAIAEEAIALSPKLAQLANAPALDGADASLKSLLDFAYGRALYFANEHVHAAEVLRAALDECRTNVWPDSDLCAEMAMAEAEARVSAAFPAANPERMRLRPETPLAARQTGDETGDQNCRAVIVGDIADDGAFTNITIPYAYPADRCTNMAMRYAAQRKYLPAAESDATHRRQNIVIRLVLRVAD